MGDEKKTQYFFEGEFFFFGNSMRKKKKNHHRLKNTFGTRILFSKVWGKFGACSAGILWCLILLLRLKKRNKYAPDVNVYCLELRYKARTTDVYWKTKGAFTNAGKLVASEAKLLERRERAGIVLLIPRAWPPPQAKLISIASFKIDACQHSPLNWRTNNTETA